MSKKKSKKRKLDKRGRPREDGARSRETTRAGRAGEQDSGTPELQAKRERALGGELRGADIEFPPDLMLARGLIDRDMRDELLRFAMLAWWLYGRPVASCAALYEKLVAGNAGDDFAPRFEADVDDPDRLKHIQGKKRRFEKMVRTLGAHLAYVKRCTFALVVPAFVEGRRSALAFLEMSHIVRGATLLVAMRAQEDRAWAKRREPVKLLLGDAREDTSSLRLPLPPYEACETAAGD